MGLFSDYVLAKNDFLRILFAVYLGRKNHFMSSFWIVLFLDKHQNILPRYVVASFYKLAYMTIMSLLGPYDIVSKAINETGEIFSLSNMY